MPPSPSFATSLPEPESSTPGPRSDPVLMVIARQSSRHASLEGARLRRAFARNVLAKNDYAELMTTNGRVALVTGAGSGIGRAAALSLLHAGYRVVLAGRRAEPLAGTVQAAGAAGARALAVSADVSRPEQVSELFGKTRKAFGRLDVLFNNAGRGGPPGPPEGGAVEQLQTVVGGHF